MTREKKFVFLAVLTFLMYGLGLFFDAHFFLLPFPIFDFVLLWGTVRFIMMNSESRKCYNYLFLFGVVLKIGVNPLLIASIFDQNELSYLQDSLLPDILVVLSLFVFLLSFVFWKIQEKLSIPFYWHIFHALLGALALTVDLRIALCFALLPAILLYIKDRSNNFRYIWSLYFCLELMTAIMLIFIS